MVSSTVSGCSMLFHCICTPSGSVGAPAARLQLERIRTPEPEYSAHSSHNHFIQYVVCPVAVCTVAVVADGHSVRLIRQTVA